jgi:hypothetical protein
LNENWVKETAKVSVYISGKTSECVGRSIESFVIYVWVVPGF